MQSNVKKLLQPSKSGQQNRIVLILGKKGSGKTTLLMKDFLPLVSKFRLVVFDPHREYLDASLIRCETLTDFKDFMLENYSAASFAVVWTPANFDEIHKFLEICYESRNLWLIVEECNMVGLGNVRQADPVFLNLVNFGRNRMISLICISKRPNQVSRDVTAQADIIISFRQDEPNDIKYLQEFCGQGVGDQVKGLADFEWRVIYPYDDNTVGNRPGFRRDNFSSSSKSYGRYK